MPEKITKEEFKAAYPDLYKEIVAETMAQGLADGIAQGKAEGLASGAEAERNRIKAVEDQILPGHEDLIQTLKFDGKTTGPEAAVRVLAAEKVIQANANKDFNKDGEGVKVKTVNPPLEEKKAEKDERSAGEKLNDLATEKMKSEKVSFVQAFNMVQVENPDLAGAYLEEIKPKRK